MVQIKIHVNTAKYLNRDIRCDSVVYLSSLLEAIYESILQLSLANDNEYNSSIPYINQLINQHKIVYEIFHGTSLLTDASSDVIIAMTEKFLMGECIDNYNHFICIGIFIKTLNQPDCSREEDALASILSQLCLRMADKNPDQTLGKILQKYPSLKNSPFVGILYLLISAIRPLQPPKSTSKHCRLSIAISLLTLALRLLSEMFKSFNLSVAPSNGLNIIYILAYICLHSLRLQFMHGAENQSTILMHNAEGSVCVTTDEDFEQRKMQQLLFQLIVQCVIVLNSGPIDDNRADICDLFLLNENPDDSLEDIILRHPFFVVNVPNNSCGSLLWTPDLQFGQRGVGKTDSVANFIDIVFHYHKAVFALAKPTVTDLEIGISFAESVTSMGLNPWEGFVLVRTLLLRENESTKNSSRNQHLFLTERLLQDDCSYSCKLMHIFKQHLQYAEGELPSNEVYQSCPFGSTRFLTEDLDEIYPLDVKSELINTNSERQKQEVDSNTIVLKYVDPLRMFLEDLNVFAAKCPVKFFHYSIFSQSMLASLFDFWVLALRTLMEGVAIATQVELLQVISLAAAEWSTLLSSLSAFTQRFDDALTLGCLNCLRYAARLILGLGKSDSMELELVQTSVSVCTSPLGVVGSLLQQRRSSQVVPKRKPSSIIRSNSQEREGNSFHAAPAAMSKDHSIRGYSNSTGNILLNLANISFKLANAILGINAIAEAHDAGPISLIDMAFVVSVLKFIANSMDSVIFDLRANQSIRYCTDRPIHSKESNSPSSTDNNVVEYLEALFKFILGLFSARFDIFGSFFSKVSTDPSTLQREFIYSILYILTSPSVAPYSSLVRHRDFLLTVYHCRPLYTTILRQTLLQVMADFDEDSNLPSQLSQNCSKLLEELFILEETRSPDSSHSAFGFLVKEIVKYIIIDGTFRFHPLNFNPHCPPDGFYQHCARIVLAKVLGTSPSQHLNAMYLFIALCIWPCADIPASPSLLRCRFSRRGLNKALAMIAQPFQYSSNNRTILKVWIEEASVDDEYTGDMGNAFRLYSIILHNFPEVSLTSNSARDLTPIEEQSARDYWGRCFMEIEEMSSVLTQCRVDDRLSRSILAAYESQSQEKILLQDVEMLHVGFLVSSLHAMTGMSKILLSTSDVAVKNSDKVENVLSGFEQLVRTFDFLLLNTIARLMQTSSSGRTSRTAVSEFKLRWLCILGTHQFRMLLGSIDDMVHFKRSSVQELARQHPSFIKLLSALLSTARQLHFYSTQVSSRDGDLHLPDNIRFSEWDSVAKCLTDSRIDSAGILSCSITIYLALQEVEQVNNGWPRMERKFFMLIISFFNKLRLVQIAEDDKLIER